ncbi:MAG: hypothetical protein FJ150_09530 [Euryarchaeota archaeon]|nr:hypothetical protein [Euryarchaeota archaeon]
MIQKFQDEFFWMMRELKGYYPWVNGDAYRLRKILYNRHHRMCPECYDSNTRDLVRLLTNEVIYENELIDMFFKALMRAEIRFISRYIPQRSNEERLTGNLVSEIDNSIYLVKDEFKELSMKRYREAREIDFFYTDMSKGGKVEKDTGADLGFILLIDLPDYPVTVKSLILQAKKINHTTQIDKAQYRTLKNINDTNCAYLFYDMDFRTLTSPMVLTIDDYDFKNKFEKSEESKTDSFSIEFTDVCDGNPLSLFIILCLLNNEYGKKHNSMTDAMSFFSDLLYKENRKQNYLDFNGRVGLVSVGKKIQYNINNDGGLNISV